MMHLPPYCMHLTTYVHYSIKHTGVIHRNNRNRIGENLNAKSELPIDKFPVWMNQWYDFR